MDHRYLETPTRPIRVNEKPIDALLDEMRGIGFQGRNLGESVEIWGQMLKEKNLSIFLGLSGAMVPAGMRRIIAFLIEKRLIDCLVSTGANLFHDAHEALGGFHYLGKEEVDGASLFECGVDRIHDIFASEKEFRRLDEKVGKFALSLKTDRPYSSREFMFLFGELISKQGGASDSIVVSAYKKNVPVFVPALSDSSIGIGLTIASRKGHHINVDQIKDVDEITRIVEASQKTGVVYIGGGVPKNFIQQTEIVASIFGSREMGHEFAIQFTTDSPQWGGLSGCTFEEAVSWGKIAPKAKKVQVFADATSALPIVSHALLSKTKNSLKNRKHPRFDCSKENLKVSF